MNAAAVVRSVAVWLAVLGLCLPSTIHAATPARPASGIAGDVSLGEGGMLLGQVVDRQGAPLPGVPVSIRLAGDEVGVAKTDANGCFAFRGLRGGVYQIVAAKGEGVFRTWAPGTAPPSAQAGVLVVAGKQAVRGQLGCPTFWLCNPWVVGAAIAAAIAVPIVLHNIDDDDPASP